MGSLVLLLGGAAQLARGATDRRGARLAGPDYTRVTLESDTPLSARHQLVDNPQRLVIDIDGLELNPPCASWSAKVRPDDPYIAGVRVGQYQPRVVRLVFDLKQPVHRSSSRWRRWPPTSTGWCSTCTRPRRSTRCWR
jgi:N-acetylmuramoyl-L-alanine amidase